MKRDERNTLWRLRAPGSGLLHHDVFVLVVFGGGSSASRRGGGGALGLRRPGLYPRCVKCCADFLRGVHLHILTLSYHAHASVELIQILVPSGALIAFNPCVTSSERERSSCRHVA